MTIQPVPHTSADITADRLDLDKLVGCHPWCPYRSGYQREVPRPTRGSTTPHLEQPK